MKKGSVLLLAPVAAGLLLSGCTAAELEQMRSDMSGLSAPLPQTGPALPSGGISEAAARSQGVVVGQVVQGSLGQIGETDLYSFSGTKGQEVVVYTQGLNGNKFGPMANLEFASTPEGSPISEVFFYAKPYLEDTHTQPMLLRETGTYTIRVKGYSNSKADLGSYRFRILQVDRAPEKRASTFTIGEVVEGEKIDAIGDIDEFTFQGRKGQKIVVYTKGLNGNNFGPMANLELLGRNGEKMESVFFYSMSYMEDKHSQPITLSDTGTYTVRIRPYSNSQGDLGPYRFQIRSVQ